MLYITLLYFFLIKYIYNDYKIPFNSLIFYSNNIYSKCLKHKIPIFTSSVTRVCEV